MHSAVTAITVGKLATGQLLNGTSDGWPAEKIAYPILVQHYPGYGKLKAGINTVVRISDQAP